MQRSRERPDAAHYGRAELAYRSALNLDPKDPGALAGMSWVANSRHDFDTGKKWAREALAVDPRLPEAHALLGDAAVEVGDYDEAFDQYQACLDIRPDLASYSRAAHLLWLTGDSLRAKLLMQKAVSAGAPHAENTAWCRAELGLMLFQEGALLPAEMQLEIALREAPAHPHVLEAMGRVKIAKKDYAAAMTLLERAVSISPRHSSLATLADLHRLTSERAEVELAVQHVLDFHTAQAKEHTHGSATNQTGVHGDADLARFLADYDRDLDRALIEVETASRTSHTVSVLDTLAWCYLKVGRDEDAGRLIRRVLQRRTPDANIMFHAGLIFARLGDNIAARKYLSQALSLNPHFHPLHARVAVATLAQLAGTNSLKGSDVRDSAGDGPTK